MRRRVAFLLIGLLTSTFTFAAAGTAWADDNPPQITSVSVVTPPVPGGPLVIDVHAADLVEQGSGIGYVRLHFDLLDASGAPIAQLEADGSLDAGGTVAATATLSPWAATGHYQLSWASVQDLTGNSRRYHRDGSLEDSPIVDRSSDNTLDLTVGDFDLTNPLGGGQGDSAAPVLDSVEQLTPTVAPGEPAAVRLATRDDLSGVRFSQVTYRSPSGSTTVTAQNAAGLAGTGLATGLVPLGAEPGTWKAVRLIVQDNVGSRIDYTPDGAPLYLPSGVRPFVAQPVIDWVALDLQVVNDGPVDTDPPVLQSVTLVTPSVVQAGSAVELEYHVTDASSVLGIVFSYQDVHNHTANLWTECITGRLVATLPLGLDPGPLKLTGVTVYDPMYQDRGYLPDGTASSAAGTGTHDLDLAALDMTVDPGRGNPALVTTPYACPGVAVVTTSAPAAALPSSTAPLTGTVSAFGHPLPDATLALYRKDLDSPVLTFERLVRTDSTGRFTEPVTVTRPSTWRVEFLGRSGPAGAPAAFGPARTVRWLRTAAVTGPTHVAAGTLATLTATVRPTTATAASSVLVVFQRWSSGAWREIARTRTGSTGTALGIARINTRPPLGTSAYRVIVPGDRLWTTVGSRAFTLTKG